MKTSTKTALLLAGLCSTGAVFGQQNSYDDRYDRRDRREDRREERRDERRLDDRLERRQEYNQRNEDEPRYNNRYEERGGRSVRKYDEEDLSKAYDEGFEDGQRNQEVEERQERRENYKNFAFGIYAGANATRFEGENLEGEKLSGRLGYQLGFFVRGGGRVYGQIGAEYLTSSSELSRTGDGTTTGVSDIVGNINQQYIHVPAYIGIKLAQSDRGTSAVRLAFGAEYATAVGVNTNKFDLKQADFKAATINGLINLGFDAGPLMVGFVYHHGFADVVKDTDNTKRRILSVNVGVKF
ncbi:hypothetical protein GCM10028807_24470 [Spirosoma daeguense]